MAENGNILNVEHEFSFRNSTDNDIFYQTADSDLLNVTNELSNHSFQQCENANYVHPSDPNFNVRGMTDISLSECFQQMKLSNDCSITLGSERGSASFPESTDMPTDNQSQEIPSPVSHDFLPQETCSQGTVKEASEKNKLSLHETSNLNISKETLPSSEEINLLIKEASSPNVPKETLTASEEIASPKTNSDAELVPEETLPCCEIGILPLPQDSTKEVFSSPTRGQDVCSNTLGGSPLPEDVRKQLGNFSSPSQLDISASPVTSDKQVTPQGIQSEGEREITSLGESKNDDSLHSSDNTFLCQTPSFPEVLVSNSSPITKSTFNPDEENAPLDDSISVTENEDPLSLSNPPAAKDGTIDSGLNVSNLVPAGDETKENSVVSPDDHLFKVPALPNENAKPIAKHSFDSSERDSFGLSLPPYDSCEVLNSSLPDNPTSVDPCDNFSDCTDGQDMSAFDSVPEKPTEVQGGLLGIPDSVVFTDFKSMESPSGTIDPFKVPNVPKEEEEEFADAVQFFKDPSSFKFLENIVTSGPPESVIPRSSLYLAFDPLHSKNVHGSRMPEVQLRRAEVGAGEASKNDSLPVYRNLVDVSARESMGNILISFDSPMAANKARDENNEGQVTPSAAPKLYTEEELQQALKIHELTLQEMHLKQHRDLEQELQKTKEESGATTKRMTSLYNALQGTLEELLGVSKKLVEDKKQMQEKISELEKENRKLEEDLKTGAEDLQSVENTFSDFHKRYEQCKAMLKSYKDNEVHLKEEFTNLTTKLNEKQHEYNELQERTQELLEKANAEVASAKKSSEGQVTVLKAQLKKAELKISGLESDIQRIKIENSQLGGICDDLMDKVSKS